MDTLFEWLGILVCVHKLLVVPGTLLLVLAWAFQSSDTEEFRTRYPEQGYIPWARALWLGVPMLNGAVDFYGYTYLAINSGWMINHHHGLGESLFWAVVLLVAQIGSFIWAWLRHHSLVMYFWWIILWSAAGIVMTFQASYRFVLGN